MARARGRERGSVQNEGGCVVEERFAFDDGERRARDAEAREHGRSGDGVGRGDDRAEQDGGGQRHPRRENLHDAGNGGGGQHHQADRESDDPDDAPAHLVERSAERFGVEQRRQEREQHFVRVGVEAREVRKVAQRKAAEHQHDRIRNAPPLRQRDQRNRNDQQNAEETQRNHARDGFGEAEP